MIFEDGDASKQREHVSVLTAGHHVGTVPRSVRLASPAGPINKRGLKPWEKGKRARA
jgi:hypothetical protein